MRYELVENIVFTDKDGKSYTIKDMRETPADMALKMNLKVTAKDMIDEIACREDVYGKDAEFMVYKIYDFNLTKLIEAKFNLDEMKVLSVPV